MVVQRRHAEDALASGLKDADLDDVGEDDGDEQAADDDGEQLRLGEDRQAGDRSTEGEGARVTHEDLGRRGIPPQEARESTDQCGTEDRQVEGVSRRVAVRRVRAKLRTSLNPLEVGDERVRAEDKDRDARGQAVEAIRQVRGVRPGRHDEVGPDEVQGNTQAQARKAQGHGRGTRERNREGARVLTELVGLDERAQGEERGHGYLSDDLAGGVQAKRTLTHDLDAVVEEANDAQADEQEDQQQAGPRRPGARDNRADQPRDDRCKDDDDATHRGRATLGEVLGRPVLADELSVLVHDQETDEDWRARHGQGHRDNKRGNKSNHRVVPFSRRMSATCHDCEPKEPLTRTTAPSLACSRASRAASCGSAATSRLSTSGAPSR